MTVAVVVVVVVIIGRGGVGGIIDGLAGYRVVVLGLVVWAVEESLTGVLDHC